MTADFRTATLAGMARRELQALIFDLTPKAGSGDRLSRLIVRTPPPKDGAKVRPDPPKPWRDVTAGDALPDETGGRRTVPRVRVFRGFPADEVGYDTDSIGRAVTSGRAWLAGE